MSIESYSESPNRLRIRNLAPEDTNQLAALEYDVWRSNPLMTREEANNTAERRVFSPPSDHESRLVATIDDDLIGVMGYYIDTIDREKNIDITNALTRLTSEPPSLGKTATFGHIYELAIHPEFQGRGYATMLAVAGLTTIRRSGVSMGKFHLTEATKRRIVTPATLEEFDVTEVRDGIPGFGEHPDLVRTQYIGNIDPSIAALSRRLEARG